MPLVCLCRQHVVLMLVLESQGSLACVSLKGSHLVDLARACRVFLLQVAWATSTPREPSIGPYPGNWTNGEQ